MKRIGCVSGKDVYLTRHAEEKMRVRRITRDQVINTLRYPWRRVRETRKRARRNGYTRYVYLSKKHSLVVVVEENDTIIVVTAIYTTKDIEKMMQNRIASGEWVEE